MTSDAAINTNCLLEPGTGRRTPQTEAGRERIATRARISTAARWERIRASGGTKLGSYSEEGLASLSAFNTGRRKSAKTKALIREKALAREKRKRQERYETGIAAQDKTLASIYAMAAPEQEGT